MAEKTSSITGNGYLVGSVGAAALSYTTFGSVGWAVWASAWGWLYCIYYWFRYYLFA